MALDRSKLTFKIASAGFVFLIIAAVAFITYAFVTANPLMVLIPIVIMAAMVWILIVQRRDAYVVPTPHEVVAVMLELAELKEGETLYDLGSGDGRILIAAARDYGAKAVGIEIDKTLIRITREAIQKHGLEDQVEVNQGSFWEYDLNDADVVTMYLRQDTNDRLSRKLDAQLHKGARVVSYTFAMTGWDPVRVDETHHVYAYEI